MEKKVYANYAELAEVCKNAGIKDSRLEKAVDAHKLPAEGKFSDEIEVVDGAMPFIKMICTDGNIASVSRIRPTAAFVESKDDVDTMVASNEDKKSSFGKVFVKSTVLNAHLPADQAKCALALAGRSFTTKTVKGFTSPYRATKATPTKPSVPIFYNNTPDDIKALKASLVVKDYWELTLLPE